MWASGDCCLWLFWMLDLQILWISSCSVYWPAPPAPDSFPLASGLLTLLLLGLVLLSVLFLLLARIQWWIIGWICGLGWTMCCAVMNSRCECCEWNQWCVPYLLRLALLLSFPGVLLCAGDSTECGNECAACLLGSKVQLTWMCYGWWTYPLFGYLFLLPSGFRPVMLFWG